MQARRRAGLRSFPGSPPEESACPASDRQSLYAADYSQSRVPSDALLVRSSARQTPGASGNRSPRSHRSDGSPLPCSVLAKPAHQPAEASLQSPQACIASVALQSSLMPKDIPQGGPLQRWRIITTFPKNHFQKSWPAKRKEPAGARDLGLDAAEVRERSLRCQLASQDRFRPYQPVRLSDE